MQGVPSLVQLCLTMKASTVDVLVLVIYVVVMLFLGYRGYKRSQSSTDYLVAGRRLGMGMYIACLSAVALGGAATVGSASLGYQHGISGIWLVTWIGLGIVALGILLGSKLANLGVLSVSEMLELRYDGRARLASAGITVVYTLMVSVTQVIAMGSILGPMLERSPAEGMLIGGVVVILYTLLGGMWSVSYTDLIQFGFMTIGVFFLMLPLSIVKSGGMSALLSEMPVAHLRFDTIGYGTIVLFFLLFFLGLLIGQDIWQRVFTAKNGDVARRGTVIAGLYCVLYAFATTCIGMIAWVRFPSLDDPQTAFARVAVEMLPAGVSGIVLAGSVSALMSTASGTLLASSTVLANDVYRRFLAPDVDDRRFLSMTRVLTGVLGVAVIVVALFVGNVIVALDIAYTYLTGAIFVPVMAALFWRRATASATFSSMCASAVVATVAMLVWGAGATPPIVLGLTTSLVVLAVVSLSTRPPSPARLAAWEERLRG